MVDIKEQRPPRPDFDFGGDEEKQGGELTRADSSDYTLCRFSSRMDCSEESVRPQIEQSSWSFPFITIIFVLIFVVTLIVVLLYKKHNKKTVVVDPWEIPRSKVQIIEKLGAGSFGEVYLGILYKMNGHSNRNCAIKTVKGGAPILERKRFLVEAEIMNCHADPIGSAQFVAAETSADPIGSVAGFYRTLVNRSVTFISGR
ncbi:hypothetical protein J6590_042474 [Homalodisca vitripennis]|nr:hypothetical protein J6590_042474 [Homalodisca vitripennis]